MVMENTSHVARETGSCPSRPNRKNDGPCRSVVVAWVIGFRLGYRVLPPRNVCCPQWLVLPEKDSHQTVHCRIEHRRDLVGESDSQLSMLQQVVKRGLLQTCRFLHLWSAAVLLH